MPLVVGFLIPLGVFTDTVFCRPQKRISRPQKRQNADRDTTVAVEPNSRRRSVAQKSMRSSSAAASTSLSRLRSALTHLWYGAPVRLASSVASLFDGSREAFLRGHVAGGARVDGGHAVGHACPWVQFGGQAASNTWLDTLAAPVGCGVACGAPQLTFRAAGSSGLRSPSPPAWRACRAPS